MVQFQGCIYIETASKEMKKQTLGINIHYLILFDLQQKIILVIKMLLKLKQF